MLWMSQCEVVPSIKEKFGLQAALDYVISEKLLNFAQAAGVACRFCARTAAVRRCNPTLVLA